MTIVPQINHSFGFEIRNRTLPNRYAPKVPMHDMGVATFSQSRSNSTSPLNECENKIRPSESSSLPPSYLQWPIRSEIAQGIRRQKFGVCRAPRVSQIVHGRDRERDMFDFRGASKSAKCKHDSQRKLLSKFGA